MKKIIYITLSMILGIFLSFLVHALIELPITWLLVKDFDKYSLGINWDMLLTAHAVFTVVLLFAGVFFGIKIGFIWWKYIYVDKKYRGKWFKIKE